MFGEGFDQTLETLRGAATAVAAAVDNAAVADASVADAKRVWEELTCAHRLLGGAIATLVRRINTPEAWAGSGARSASELVARTAGVGEGEARRMLETAERLADQPEVADALKAGRMSSTQAQLVADAVAANPDAATELVAAAETHALPRLRELCNDAKHRADADPEATYARVHRARRCRTFIDSDQTFRIFGQGTIDDGARITNELDRLTDLEFRRARKEGRRESLEAYRFDALVKMARRSARLGQPWPVAGAGGMSDTAAASRPSAGPTPGDPAPARRTGDLPDPSTAGGPECAPHGPQGPASPPEDSGWGAPSTSSRENPTFLAILRIEHAALVRGWIEGEETCEIAGLGPVPVRVARELLGESILKLIITRGRDANVTHLGRGPTVAQRVALLWRQPRCSVRGCAGRHIQIDHREDWARTRHTRLDELDPLCTYHHDLKTRENWAFTAGAGPGGDGAGGGGDGGDGNSGDGSGERDFVPPSDPRHPDRVWADRRRNGTTG